MANLVIAPFTVPDMPPGDVVVGMQDDILGFKPTTTFTVTTGGNDHPPSIQGASISGRPFVNSTFTAVATGVSDPDDDPVTLHYAWTINGTAAGTDSSTFSSTALRGGDALDVAITPVDSGGLRVNALPSAVRSGKRKKRKVISTPSPRNPNRNPCSNMLVTTIWSCATEAMPPRAAMDENRGRTVPHS